MIQGNDQTFQKKQSGLSITSSSFDCKKLDLCYFFDLFPGFLSFPSRDKLNNGPWCIILFA